MIKDSDFKTFDEFWPYYLGEHRLKITRALHYLGTGLSLIALACAAITLSAWWLLAGIMVGYLFAWIGHFGFEHNRPATFKYPLWSLIADYKMFYLAITGQLMAHLSKHLGKAAN